MGKKYLDIGNRLRILRGNKTQSEFAADIGTTLRAYQYYEAGDRVPSIELLTEIAKKYNKSVDWILTGAEYIIEDHEIKKIAEASSLSDQSEFVFVPQFSGKISAGEGIEAENKIDMRIAFRRDWIKRKGDPSKMSLIKVSGDSMEPTLMHGDLVLVNHARNYLDPQGGLYAISANNIIMIKRLQIEYPSRKVQIISDNPKYKTIEADLDQVHINGKVIWFGREIER